MASISLIASVGKHDTACSNSAGLIHTLDIFESPIPLHLGRASPTDPNSTPTDLTAEIPVREKPRLMLSTGAWAGSNDGSVQGQLLLRNIFGGAESLSATAQRGTRTRSAYTAAFDTPILSNPDFRFELSGLASATHKPWASHEELLKGGIARLRYGTKGGHRHELSYGGFWRQITGLPEQASMSVRQDAGDSFKSSVTHSWTRDERDNPLLPTQGTLMKTVAEVAGVGPLAGDVAFAKGEAETQVAMPFLSKGLGMSLTAGLRGGILYPLALGQTPLAPSAQHSRINDRFTLGGPTDVRGFRLAGLGPRDGEDSIGGDIYAAGGASLYVPFPRVGKEVPLRLQLFVNGGRLLGMPGGQSTSEKQGTSSNQQTASDVGATVRNAVAELGREMPSLAAGVGLVYVMPVARFELNFSLPLLARKGEEARKGLSLGVGISFL